MQDYYGYIGSQGFYPLQKMRDTNGFANPKSLYNRYADKISPGRRKVGLQIPV
ncbi:hypothetical protein [Butyricicoccus pullicaecorum]|uniref:hypothetical protein n=1 Tax=Butyricicoccus pullicaecorum TaxID=501571 RepID=UPI003990B85D